MTTTYGLKVSLDLTYEDAIEKATAALKEEGFGVLTKIDVKDTLKQKMDADFRQYVILGACNPNLAHQALKTDLDVGLLLPCNVIVYESDDDKSVVSIVDPMQMLGVADNKNLQNLATEANTRLTRIVENLATL